jgi:hypothetical protein
MTLRKDQGVLAQRKGGKPNPLPHFPLVPACPSNPTFCIWYVNRIVPNSTQEQNQNSLLKFMVNTSLMERGH